MLTRRIAVVAVLLLLAGAVATIVVSPTPTASAASVPQQLHFEYGPVHLGPGQNIIQISPGNIPKPTVPGWITGIRANMVFPDGSIPDSDVIMLHHAVWLNLSAGDSTTPSFPERFFAVGEEKTALALPTGFGYRYEPTDQWRLNYMLHVLVNQSFDVKVTYDLDFVPDSDPGKLRSVRPLWMDVQNGSGYPVFDALAGTGVAGKFTYPAMATNPYGGGAAKNEYTVPVGGVLVATAGHLHSGGLSTEMFVTRNVLTGPKTKRIFKSEAVYYEPAGPVSWDVSLTATPATWKVHVRPGDTLSIQATYDTERVVLVRVDGHHDGVVRAGRRREGRVRKVRRCAGRGHARAPPRERQPRWRLRRGLLGSHRASERRGCVGGERRRLRVRTRRPGPVDPGTDRREW